MRLKQWVFVLFLYFIISIPSFSQEDILRHYSPIDSLVDKDYKVLIKHFNRTAPDYQVEPDSLFAHEVAMTYLWKAYKAQDSLRMGKAYSMLGQLEGYRLDYLDKAIVYTKNKNDRFQPALTYNLKFAKHYTNGNYKEASKALLKAYEYAKKSNNLALKCDFEYNIHILNGKWGDKRLAVQGLIDYLSFLDSAAFDSMFPTYTYKQKEESYLVTHYNIGSIYYDLKEYRKATAHLDTIYQQNFENDISRYTTQFPEYKNKSLGLKGAISYREGNYQEGLQYTNLYLLHTEVDNLYGISRSSLIKGLILWKLGTKKEAIQNIKRADSIYQSSYDEYEELGEGYQLLINYYKEIDDTENQLVFLNKLIVFEKNISSNYIEIGNRIIKEYTVPQLLAEKERTIEELAKRTTKNAFYYYVFIGISVTALFLFFFQWYKKKQLHKRFLAITESSDKENIEHQEIKNDILVQKQELYEFDEQQINQIVNGLAEFETFKSFLDPSITLQSLAEKIGTNTSYLSKYINTEKKINFATYISDLRIEHAIYKLQEDHTLRSYTIEAIASEVGFSNTRSFTNHFKRVTGITVSYFIKKLSSS